MGRIDHSLTVLKQATQAAAPAIKREIATTGAPSAPIGEHLGRAANVFEKLRPVAERLLASAGQTYGANMASVAHDLKLAPAERAAAFRARANVNLAGRTGLVTGAAGNIGSETAFMMAHNKMKVMLTDIPQANLDAIAETCELLGAPKVVISKHDLTDEGERASLIDNTMASVGSPFASVFSAGIYGEGGLWHQDPDKSAALKRRYILANKVNVEAPVALAEALVPHLNPGAHLLAINSLAGEVGVKGESMYCGTKFALDAFWTTLSKEHSNRGLKFEQVFPSALLGAMAAGREGLEAELLHFPIEIVHAVEAALKAGGNSYLPRIPVSGTISPYAADHG